MTSAQRSRSPSQMSAPQEVKTTSKEPDSLSGRLSTSLCTNVARLARPTSRPARAPSLIPSPEKSTPVTTAPRRAQLRVSRPKWHCRCSSVVPSPTSGPSSPSSISLSERAARLEAGDVVQLRADVQADGLVPAREVGLEVVVEHRQASSVRGPAWRAGSS